MDEHMKALEYLEAWGIWLYEHEVDDVNGMVEQVVGMSRCMEDDFEWLCSVWNEEF